MGLNIPREQWTIETSGERGSRRYLRAARHDDDMFGDEGG